MIESKIGSRKVRRRSVVEDEDLIQIIRSELEDLSELRKVFTCSSRPDNDFNNRGGIYNT